MTDRTTKILFAVIALGLWVNVATSLFLFRPMTAAAQMDLTRIQSNVSRIERDVSSIKSDVSDIKSDVSRH
jgi:peptidoglycan hydrolase CwlO-like protein